jgi:hypothetical protein
MRIDRRGQSRTGPHQPCVPSVPDIRVGTAGSRRRSQPLTSAADALSVISLASSCPPRPETVVLLLDDELSGRACMVVEGTTERDDVLDVARLAVEVAEQGPCIHAAVLATVRTGPVPPASVTDAPDDVGLWLELLDTFDDAGVELLDWFVVLAGRVESLRATTGMPDLWPDR